MPPCKSCHTLNISQYTHECWVMSHTWTIRAIHINKSCHTRKTSQYTYECVMSHTRQAPQPHTVPSVIFFNGPPRTFWVASLVIQSFYEWGMSFTEGLTNTWRHITWDFVSMECFLRRFGFCYEWVHALGPCHIWMSHVTYEWVMAHTYGQMMSHIWHMTWDSIVSMEWFPRRFGFPNRHEWVNALEPCHI